MNADGSVGAVVQKRLKGGAADYNLILGFIPVKVIVTVLSGTNPDEYTWYGELMEDSAEAAAGNWEYGIKNTGASGILTYMDTVAKGISAYDGSKVVQTLIENPSTGKDEAVTIDPDFVAGAAQPTARTGTAVGSVTRPSTHNDYVYECTISGGVYGTEPTNWPLVPGETVSDGTNTWICREQNVVAGKGLGITLGGTLLESDKIVFVTAFRGETEELGDIG